MLLPDAAVDGVAAICELLLPSACAGCACPGQRLCGECRSISLTRTEVTGIPVIAAADYADGLRTALVAYKDRDRRELAAPLAHLLAIAVASVVNEVGPSVVLVPVPSAHSVARRRGGDHVLRLARRCGRILDLPVCAALSLNRAVQDGARLSARSRALNMRGAMTAVAARRRACAQRTMQAVIVDDIVTTGCTIREAQRALGAAGWQVSAAAVVARTHRRVQVST